METQLKTKGIIFDIQGFSVHDGPGCRTLVFMKGCTMQCFWCSNPEGIHQNTEPLYFRDKCILDKKCIPACKRNAITEENGKLNIDREKCKDCGDLTCIKACLTGALRKNGYEITVAELMDLIRRDRQYWGPGGGITLTGGEPLLQIDFALALLKECYEAYIHTGIETCGNIITDYYERITPYTEWIFFDLKHMNEAKHKAATGASNTLILDNARWLSGHFKGRLIFRLPLIPGFNDSKKNIVDIAEFLHSVGKDEINLLPLHHMGIEKYSALGLQYKAMGYNIPVKENLMQINDLLDKKNIKCYIATETPF